MLKIFLLSHYFGIDAIEIFDLDRDVKTTTIIHNDFYLVHNDITVTEDTTHLYQLDSIFETPNQNRILVVDMPAGKAGPFLNYWQDTGQYVAREFNLTTVGLHPIVRTKESLREALYFIERFGDYFHIAIGKNLVGTANDREEAWTRFLGEPGARKLAGKLQKSIAEKENITELFLPEIPSKTYSRLMEGLPLIKALENTSKLGFPERIRLKNLMDIYLKDSIPLLKNIGMLPHDDGQKTDN